MKKMIYEFYDGSELVDAGTAYELADKYFVGVNQIKSHAKNGGLLLRQYTVKRVGLKEFANRSSSEIDEKIKEYLGQGLEPKAISERLNLSTSAIYKRIAKMRKKGEIK